MSTITPTAPLTADVEADLVVRAQAGDKAATARLVEAHVRYVRSEARTYAAAEPLLEADDLVSAGLEALLGAIATYDPSKGARLLTHARRPIALAFAEEVAAYGRAIAVPGRTLRKYRRAIRETTTLDEARALARTRDGMDPETFDSVHYAMTGGESLDATFDNSDRLSPGAPDGLGNPAETSIGFCLSTESPLLGTRGPTPEGSAETRLLATQALAALDDRAKEVVALAYLTGEDLSDAAIAVRLGVSRPTVTRLRNAALEAMRDALDV